MTWRAEDPMGDEASKVKYDIVEYTRGAVLDLGCGPSKAFPHFIGVDSCKDTELFGIKMRPDLVVEDCTDLGPYIKDESCDAIFSSHLLEHIKDYRGALKDWWRCIKNDGYLILYLPHKNFYPNIGKPGANPDHKHDFDPIHIIDAIREISVGCDVVVREDRNGGMEYSFLLVFRKLKQPVWRNSYVTKQQMRPRKTACVVRYGGFGDMIQAANILPMLKRKGYHVTVMTTPKGQDILKNDPNIDDWFIQDENQVPNAELWPFWKVISARFDKWINLCESVEGTLLAMPGRANHMWSKEMRHKYLDKNYLEFTAEIADLPYRSEGFFYPTSEEAIEANARLLDGGMNVMFALAGSSMHKFYPHQDTVIARILINHPNVRIFLVGDDACRILEQGWQEETRVICLSGEINIRQTLALAQRVDVVVGCETGVLNAVAFEDCRKVALLSHSSHENLTKHWLNTQALAPRGLDCYPCHRLHYGTEFCREDKETGAAMCQRMISPDDVYGSMFHAEESAA